MRLFLLSIALLFAGCHLVDVEVPGVPLPTVNVTVPPMQVQVVVPTPTSMPSIPTQLPQ